MELESKQIRPLLKKALCFFMTALMLFSSFGGTFSVFAVDGKSMESSAKAGVLTITAGETKTIEVYEGFVTYLKFVPAVSGIYSFYSSANLDTYGYLYDENMECLTENDDDMDYNFRIFYRLEKGKTYYYGAKYLNGSAGSFNVVLECDEPYCSHEHTTVYDAVDATCEADGTTEGKKCEDCQLWLVKPETIYAVHPDENDDFFCDECGYSFSVIGEGICGRQWHYSDDGDYLVTDNAHYTLYDNGTLVIEGDGGIGFENDVIPPFAQSYSDEWENTYVRDYFIKKIIIGEGITGIGDNLFENLHALTSVDLPSTIETIWSDAFDECDKITDVYYNGTMEEFKNIRVEHFNEDLLDANIHCLDGDFETVFTEGDFTYRVNFMGNNGTVTVTAYNGNGGDVVIPEKVRGYDVSEISSEAFADDSAITSISISSTITRIHHGAFESCLDIERVYITDITKWCNIFFDNETATPLCQGAALYINGELLTDVIIPEGVTRIANYAFYGCTSIESVEIPESVTYIGWRTFNYCDTLRDVYYRGDEDMWNDIDFGDMNTSLENAEIHFMSGHEHSFGEESFAPTCDCEGYTLYICMFCGYSYNEISEDALGHDYQTVVTAPDCDSEGYATYTCSRCGDWYEDEFIDSLGHDYEAEVTEPTCQAGGYTTYTCTVCGNGYSDDFTDSIVHIYESVVTPPTCEEIGFTTHTCTMCGDVIKNEGVDSLGHDYESEVTEPTCTDKGYTTHTCTRCYDSYTDSEVEAIGHTEADAVEENVVEATCTEKGSYESVVYCSVCDAELSRENKEIAAKGHTSGAEATCTEAQKCTVCKAVLKNAKGHTEVTDKGRAATCTQTGLTDGKHCSVCGDITVAQRVINALGHNKASHAGKAATCTAGGWSAYETCSRCSYTTYKAIKALGHNYSSSFTTDKAATYKEAGSKSKHCTRCDAKKDVTAVARLTLTKVKGLKATPDEKSIKFTWTKVAGAESYEVQYSTNGKKWTKVKATKNSVTVKKLKAGTAYKVKVKAVAGTNNGAFSSVLTTSTEPSKVNLTKVTSSKSKQITVNWKKVSGATGYEVQYSTAKNFKKNAKTATIKKQSTVKTTLKKLTKGKKYYIRVRAYKTVGKTKIYGSWSSVKSIKSK